MSAALGSRHYTGGRKFSMRIKYYLSRKITSRKIRLEHRDRHQFYSVRQLRRSVMDLQDNALRLDRKELVKRFDWLRSKVQAHICRSHGTLYRFDPDVSTVSSLVELRQKLVADLDSFLIWLCNNSKETRYVVPIA